jgi:capsular exopolysaccharide synthesis family protein
MGHDATVLQYEKDLGEQQKKREESLPFYAQGEQAPEIKKYDLKIGQLRQAIEKQRAEIVKRLQKRVYQELLAKQAEDARTITIYIELESKLKAEIQAGEDEIKAGVKSSLDLDSHMADIEQLDTIAKKLRTQIEVLNVDLNAPSRVTIQDRADVRKGEVEKRKLLAASAAALACMALVLLGVSYREFAARRITTGEDVIFGLGWRLVGALPALPERGRRKVLGAGDYNYWQSLLTESVDATRAMLLHAARVEGIRSVMVTSAVAGEGKTSLSCHLATSLARAGRRTLLVDCDLRSPAIHRLFELPVEPGFSEMLDGKADCPEVIRSTAADNLWVIPAGRYNAQTIQLLSQDVLSPVFNRLKEQFDFIIIDSSPVLPVADSLVIGQHVDVLIFSLLRGVSRIPNVYAAYQRLNALGIRIMGAVVSGVSKDSNGGYSYYQYYGSRES